jgi:pimeloyl-ACP methyl ester carboxylesterase
MSSHHPGRFDPNTKAIPLSGAGLGTQSAWVEVIGRESSCSLRASATHWYRRAVPPRVTRHFVDLPQGTVHYAQAGGGDPALLLHQTPRSWDEYRDVLPLLGRTRRAIAMDTIGFGDSTPLPPGSDSIEAWSEVVLALLDALDIGRTDLVGHHTGAVVALETATRAPDRVRSVVLSSSPYDVSGAPAAAAPGRAVVDEVEPSADGSHLLELWRTRAAFYPEGDVDLLQRFIADALKAGSRAAEGHRVVARYDTVGAVARIACPVLLIGATADPFAYPSLARLRAALPHADVSEIEGGMVPLPDQLPAEFAAVVERFLEKQ